MCEIIFWILICGIAGGARNALLDQRAALESDKKTSLPQYPWLYRSLEGVLAAATVPLFLSLIGNSIVRTILDPTAQSPDRLEDILKFAGFCLIASLSSRIWLDGLSQRVFDLQKKLDENTKELKKVAETADAAVEPDKTVTAAETLTAPSLSIDEKSVLAMLSTGPFLIRSIEGLAGNLSMTLETLKTILDSLVQKGLVRHIMTRQGMRWVATPEGIEQANRVTK